ncbi:MAG: alpha/beta fold hydrolase [Candidatus Dormibacteria bacterium]
MITSSLTGEEPRANLMVRGAGAPLLLLHGWGTSSELFAPVLDQLQHGRWLIVPDLPGFGGTPPPLQAWSVHEYSSWVVALLDRLGVTRCDVLGHSNGGRVALVMATEHPERIGKLVLVAAAGIRPRRRVRDRAAVRSYKMLRRVERTRLIPRTLRESARARADRRGSADYRAASGVMRATLVRLVNEDLAPLLARIEAPTLLVWGDRDTETPIEQARVMERRIPDAGLVVLEGGSHYAYLEQAARFCHIVDVFLRSDTAA